MRTWAINLKPLQDELLSSWLIRLSLANGTDPAGLTGAIWDNWRAWTVDIDRATPIDRLRKLSEVSGQQTNTLKELTLQTTIEKILNSDTLDLKKTWTWVIPTGNRNRTRINGLHFCSECLKTPPVYFRKSWRLAWNTVCPEHKILLSISCPTCNTVISPHLVTYEKTDLTRCVTCGYDISQIPPYKISKDVVNLQNLLNSTALSPNEAHKFLLEIHDYRELFAVVLFFIKFFHTAYKKPESFQVIFSELNLNMEDMFFSHTKGNVFEAYPVLERYYLMLCVSRLFKLSKNNIIDLFIQAGISRQMLNVSKNKPKLIKEISNKLLNHSNSKKSNGQTKKSITPRSKDEVEDLMNEIRQFL